MINLSPTCKTLVKSSQRQNVISANRLEIDTEQLKEFSKLVLQERCFYQEMGMQIIPDMLGSR